MTARTAIQKAGGLANASDLSRKWELSRTRVSELTHNPTFPQPVGEVGGRPVWLWVEAKEWRERRQKGR